MKCDGWGSGSISSSSFIMQLFYLIQPYSFYHLVSLNLFPETKCLQLHMPVTIDSKCTMKAPGMVETVSAHGQSQNPQLFYSAMIWGNCLGICYSLSISLKVGRFIYFIDNQCLFSTSQYVSLLSLL